jgi:desulfoferrodoxin-like iron-binding protein
MRSIHTNFLPEFLKGGIRMANVKTVGEVYRCEICGNVVEVKEVGGGELVCCGQPMKLEKEK